MNINIYTSYKNQNKLYRYLYINNMSSNTTRKKKKRRNAVIRNIDSRFKKIKRKKEKNKKISYLNKLKKENREFLRRMDKENKEFENDAIALLQSIKPIEESSEEEKPVIISKTTKKSLDRMVKTTKKRKRKNKKLRDHFMGAQIMGKIKFGRVGGKKRSKKRSKKRNKKRKWSLKYKRRIDCKNPKGFSQKQYCKRILKNKKSKKRKK